MVKTKSFLSNLLLALVILGIAICLIILTFAVTMESIYEPKPQQQLILKIHSITMSGLNVSCFLTETRWNVTMLFVNRNSMLEMSIHSFESSLYYNHNNPISCAAVEAMHLGPKKQRLVEMQFNRAQCGEEQPYVNDWVLERIRKDEIKGEMSFAVGMKLRVLYRTGILEWNYNLNPHCPKLHMQLVPSTGNGGIIFEHPKKCLVTPLNS